jgi:predicted Rossmann fold nucleotide-binding protein DprA/Smf involved in DNA uptake
MTKYYAGVGSRQTPENILHLMTRIAMRMAELGWVLRSGGAKGADYAFEKGAGDKKEIYLPWRGFGGATPSTSWGAIRD